MACPTCDHTMKGLGGPMRWCPRCGTLIRVDLHDYVLVDVPYLIERIKAFRLTLADWQLDQLDELGVTEAIQKGD